MRKFFSTTILLLFFILIIITAIFSITGYETNKFNKIISEKINTSNEKISLTFKKIKFKLDFQDASLFLETKDPILEYQNLNIPIKNIKVYLDFFSIVKSKPKIDKVNIESKEINIDLLKKIIIKTKPSNLNSIITNKIRNGTLITNIELYFNDNFKIDNFIARGEVKKMTASINDKLAFKNTSFNFFFDNTDVLIKDIKSQTDGFLIEKGSVQLEKNEKIIVKSDFSTAIKINKSNEFIKYFKNFDVTNKKINLLGKINHNLNITFDSTFKVVDFIYEGKGRIDDFDIKLEEPLKNVLLQNNINNFNLKDTNINFRYDSKKKKSIKMEGKYRVNENDFQKYNFENNLFKNKSNIKVDFKFIQRMNIDLINYQKKENIIATISSNFSMQNDSMNFEKIDYLENKNLINIKGLKIKKNNFITLKSIKVKTFDNGILNNDFILDFRKIIAVRGKKFDARNLNKLLNKKSNNDILKKISKDIDIDLEQVETPLSKKLKDFKLIGEVKNGKFVKISSKGDFGNNKFLDISLKNNKSNNKKFLEIYSDLPQPLLTEYSFFKGLSDGTLFFTSVIDGDQTDSNLIIENFKIIDAPGVVKLLSLADFGGLADLAEGEGLSFEKLEIKMNQHKGHIKLNELYAVGPSISVLMDGYKEANGLTSLRGTLVPAKNLNKFISKIPVIGKIIIPKEVGEGLFGVSFKMKGQTGKIKTTINPIRTLTPRFIQKIIEKKSPK
jgi:hypothetical protein